VAITTAQKEVEKLLDNVGELNGLLARLFPSGEVPGVPEINMATVVKINVLLEQMNTVLTNNLK